MTDELVILWARRLAETLAPTTITTYVDILDRADRELPHGLTANTDELRAWIHARPAPSTRKVHRAALRSFYAWCVAEGYADYDPAEAIPQITVRAGLPRIATDEQLARALAEAPEHIRLWIVLAAYAGLRCIEIARLHREDITEQQISVHRGKGNRARAVPTSAVVWATVRDLPSGPVTGNDARQISSLFQQWCRRRGIAGLSMHRLRGWMATTSYRQTLDAMALRDVLGHASLATTQVYVGVGEQQRRAVIDSLPMPAASIGAGVPTPRRSPEGHRRQPRRGVAGPVPGGRGGRR